MISVHNPTSTPSANAQNRSLEHACARSLVARVRIAPPKSNAWAVVSHPRSDVVAPFVRTPLHSVRGIHTRSVGTYSSAVLGFTTSDRAVTKQSPFTHSLLTN